MTDPMICPQCNGAMVVMGLVKYATRDCDVKRLPCSMCKGEGQVTAEQLQRGKEGRRFREDRLRRNESLREAAQRLGISPRAVSDIEHGRVPRD